MVASSFRSGRGGFRSSQRLTITVPHATLAALAERSGQEEIGRAHV